MVKMKKNVAKSLYVGILVHFLYSIEKMWLPVVGVLVLPNATKNQLMDFQTIFFKF